MKKIDVALRDLRINTILEEAKTKPMEQTLEILASLLINTCKTVFRGKKDVCLKFLKDVLDHSAEIEQDFKDKYKIS